MIPDYTTMDSDTKMTTNEQPAVALGLDLGITYSRFTTFKNNKFELIPDDEGHFQTPSFVAFTEF